MSLKYQEKIDKYVDNLFYNLNSNSNVGSIQPLNDQSSIKIKDKQELKLQRQSLQNPFSIKQQKNCNSITKQDIQFLQLLYPYQQPKQIMQKLMRLYKQQNNKKNSFQQLKTKVNKDIDQEEQEKSLNQNRSKYFKSIDNINLNKKNKSKREMIKQNNYNPTYPSLRTNTKMELDRIIEQEEKNQNFINKQYQRQNQQKPLQYNELIDVCYVSLGEKLVQTHISKPQVQISNVNFYTRQYIMPHIVQTLDQIRRKEKLKQQNYNKSKHDLRYNRQRQRQLFQNYNNQKVFYIPANQKGNGFDLNGQVQEQLFDYINHNDYNRLLRDINQTIQKTLLKYRQNKYKSFSPLYTRWNIFIFFMFLLNIFMYLARIYFIQSSNFQIVCFFVTALTFIIILGHSLNNYKVQVNKKNMIQCINEQIKNYLNFYNCKSRNLKLVLGKYFFWLEIHVKSPKEKSVEKYK